MKSIVSFGKQTLFYFLITISFFTTVRSNSCPLLKNFENSTGILFVEKNLLTSNDSVFLCQWSISGSSDQKIFLEFDFVFIPIPLDEYLRDGCRRGAVKFWTPGVDEEKISLCGDRRNLRINGVGQNLFIELLVIDPLIDFRFRMRYRFIENERSLTTPSFLNDLSPQSSNECGRPAVKAPFQSKIVGGQQVVPHTFPWQVLLFDRMKFCGASVLNENWIVTAAHCVSGINRQNFIAEFGVHDRLSIEKSRVVRKIEKIIIHPTYSGKSSRWIHDIALLRLSESLRLNGFVRSICLPSKEISVQPGDKTIVTGWGDTRGTGSARFLRQVQVSIQPSEHCQFKKASHETSLCAGLCQNKTCDACQGDSGGPMVIFHDGRWHLVGLISWGFSCAGLGVYTKVSYYLDWIEHWISQ